MKKFKTTNTTLRHCGILTQWLAGIEGIGINGEVKKKEEKKIKVHVSGYIEMKETEFNRLHEGVRKRRGIMAQVKVVQKKAVAPVKVASKVAAPATKPVAEGFK